MFCMYVLYVFIVCIYVWYVCMSLLPCDSIDDERFVDIRLSVSEIREYF